MREFLSKLLDEENRQADIVAFGQIMSLIVAAIVTLLIVIPALYQTMKTGKIDSNAVWVLTVWLGSAATFGVADSRRPNTSPPAPPTAPSTPPAPPTPQPPVAPSPPPPPGQPGGRTV